MAVIEVPMISGFRADVESLERVRDHINTHAFFVQDLEIIHPPEHAQIHKHLLAVVVVSPSDSQMALQAGQVLR